METSHLIYMPKCDQLIGFCGTSNSKMAICEGDKFSQEVRKRRPPLGLLNQSVFVTICVTNFVGSRQ